MDIEAGAMTGKFRNAVSLVEAFRGNMAGNFYPQPFYR
jgi:hypothetical protein